jgi:hypothetical protein
MQRDHGGGQGTPSAPDAAVKTGVCGGTSTDKLSPAGISNFANDITEEEPMPSKQVVDRKKSADVVAAAADVHATRVAKAVEVALSPFLEKGEQMPDVKGLSVLVGKWLSNKSAAMTTADEAHIHELSDDDPVRQARDEAQAALSDELVELREWMTGLFGARAVRSLGFSAETPRDPAALSQFAGEVCKSLKEKEFPAPKRAEVNWSPAKEATKIEQLRSKLATAIADVAREAREAQGTLANKNAALAEYDDAFRRASPFLEGLFTLAGETDLANRVRPSTRRPGQTEELAPQPEPDAAGEPKDQ